MSEKKDVTKSLKRPDAFQVQVLAAFDWCQSHVKQILMVVAPILAVIIIGAIWQLVSKQREAGRLEGLATIELQFQDEEAKAGKERQAIQNKIDEIMTAAQKAKPAEPQAAKDEEVPEEPVLDPESKARKEKLEKEMAAIKAEHSKTLVEFQKFHKENEKTAEGWMSGLKAASILIEGKKFAEARPLLENVLKASTRASFYQIHGRLMYLGLLEEIGEVEPALKEVDTLMSVVGDDLKPYALLIKGRLQLLKNSKDEARATFDELLTKYASSPEAEKARGMKALLN